MPDLNRDIGVLSERIVLPLRERCFVPGGAVAQWVSTLEALHPSDDLSKRSKNRSPHSSKLRSLKEATDGMLQLVLNVRAGKPPRPTNTHTSTGSLIVPPGEKNTSIAALLPTDWIDEEELGLCVLYLETERRKEISVWPETLFQHRSSNGEEIELLLRAVTLKDT